MTRLTPQPTCAPHSITSSACCWRCKGTSRQRLRGPEIDDQLELGRLLDRQFGRFCALQDFIDKNRSPLEISSVVCRVGDQPPSLCCVTIARHDREVVLGRELHDYARLRLSSPQTRRQIHSDHLPEPAGVVIACAPPRSGCPEQKVA